MTGLAMTAAAEVREEMMKTTTLIIAMSIVLAACTPAPLSPERAADVCEAQARAAQGPTGRIAVGVNSNSGPFTNAEIGISGDYLAGRDPVDVYTQCVIARTGTGPIRPPRLR